MPGPAAIQAKPGDGDGCQACGGRVYEPEKVSSKTGLYHKQCFSCHQCKKKLDSTLVYAFQAPDSNIYCRNCRAAFYNSILSNRRNPPPSPPVHCTL